MDKYNLLKHYTQLFTICCLLVFSACSPSEYSSMPDEIVIQQLLQDNPDSLAAILEEQIVPSTLPDSGKADYAWWLIQAHQKQRRSRSLVNDTLIRFSVDYYKKVNSPKLLKAYLLAAEQSNWSGSAPIAEDSLLNEALQQARLQKDTTMILDCCFKLTKLQTYLQNTERVSDLIQTTKQYAAKPWNVEIYANLSKQFSILEQCDSVSKYQLLGIEIARKQQDPIEFNLTRWYAENLNKLNRSNEALVILKDLEQRFPGMLELSFNFIGTWISLGKPDSATVYIDSMQQILNPHKGHEEVDVLEFILETYRYVIQLKKGEPVSLNATISATGDNLLTRSRNAVKIDRERQFAQNKLVKDNLNLEIERGKLHQRFLWAGIITLFVIALIIYFYQRKLLVKERLEQQAKEQLHLRTLQLLANESVIRKNEELISTLSSQLDENGELKEEIEQISQENENLKQKNETLQKDIKQHSHSLQQKDQEMVVYEKLTQQNLYLLERERFLTSQLITHTEALHALSKKPRYIEEDQWVEIIHFMNRLYDNFTFRLHTDFPILTEEDIRHCCLIKLRLSTSVIAILTAISPSSVTKRKQRIKEKINQQRPDEIQKEQALEVFLWNY